MSDPRPVGVFDSGVGGISVLSRLRRELPGERFIYYGDLANAPYGTKSEALVLSLVTDVFHRLLAMDVKAVVIACNTATAVAAADLRGRYPELPIIGMEPALKPAHALRRNGAVLVLATPVTLSLPKFRSLFGLYGEGAVPVPCPGLMELVEGENAADAERYLREKLAPYAGGTVDAVVLGCTHYVFLRPLLARILSENTAVVDGNEGTARQLRRVLEKRGLLAEGREGGFELLTSGDAAADIPKMTRLLSLADRI